MPRLITPTTGVIIAVDPGMNGGIAKLGGNNNVELFEMPGTEQDFCKLIEILRNRSSSTVGVIEWINPAIQRIKKSDMSKLYGSYMSSRMLMTCNRIPFETVTPQKWQPGLGIQKRKEGETQTQWKRRLQAKAQQLFPHVETTLKTADALLIAEYYRRFLLGMIK